jgi:hypothetical protein
MIGKTYWMEREKVFTKKRQLMVEEVVIEAQLIRTIIYEFERFMKMFSQKTMGMMLNKKL